MIPIVAVGGALPALLGSLGVLVCAGVARDESKTTRVRLMMCTIVTLFAWAAFALLMLAAARARGGALIATAGPARPRSPERARCARARRQPESGRKSE